MKRLRSKRRNENQLAIELWVATVKTGRLPKVRLMPMYKGRALFKREKVGTWTVGNGIATCATSYSAKKPGTCMDAMRITLSSGHWRVGLFEQASFGLPRRAVIGAAWHVGFAPDPPRRT